MTTHADAEHVPFPIGSDLPEFRSVPRAGKDIVVLWCPLCLKDIGEPFTLNTAITMWNKHVEETKSS